MHLTNARGIENIGWTALGWIVILCLAAFFLAIMMEVLRNIWINWGLSHPFLSSLGAMIVGLILWWAFGLIMWLGTPKEKEGHSIEQSAFVPVQYMPATREMSFADPLYDQFFERAKKKAESKINPRVTREEQDQIDEIFKNSPRVKVAISSLSAEEGEEARPALEAAAWLKEAMEKAGVVTEFTAYGNPEILYQGATIYWMKDAENNEMVSRIVKAAAIKRIHPREVTRPASKKCEIELMIGLNPYG